jgi:hypothetical protein
MVEASSLENPVLDLNELTLRPSFRLIRKGRRRTRIIRIILGRRRPNPEAVMVIVVVVVVVNTIVSGLLPFHDICQNE